MPFSHSAPPFEVSSSLQNSLKLSSSLSLCNLTVPTSRPQALILFLTPARLVVLKLSSSFSLRPDQLSQAALKTHRHSSLSPSLSQAPSFLAAGPTQPSQVADRLRPMPPIAYYRDLGFFFYFLFFYFIYLLFFSLLWTVGAAIGCGCGCGYG